MKMKRFSKGSAALNLLGVFLLVGVVAAGVVASQNPQIFKPSAHENIDVASVANGAPLPPAPSGNVLNVGTNVEVQSLATAAVTQFTEKSACVIAANLYWPKSTTGGYDIWLYPSGTTNCGLGGCYKKAISANSTVSATGPGGFLRQCYKVTGCTNNSAMPALKLNTQYGAAIYRYSTRKYEYIWFNTPATCK